ncbi:MAG: hypothetical protein LBG06_01060 [Deltaproteobacteria bacterium]|nr:hypothetical protein [Deltaproteobacteria bacterium]
MRIIPFPPPVPEGAPARAPGPAGSAAGGFEQALGETPATAGIPPARGAPAPPGPPPAWSSVGLENLRARENPSELDLSQAAGLLSGLLDKMRGATPASLARVHDLEGVLYYYPL